MLCDPFTVGSVALKIKPIFCISQTDLDRLMSTLEVNAVALSECLVSGGGRLEMGAASFTGLHYNIKGTGKMFIPGFPPIELKPHALIILPANTPFRVETAARPGGLMPASNPNLSSMESSGSSHRFLQPMCFLPSLSPLWSNSAKPTALIEHSNWLSQS